MKRFFLLGVQRSGTTLLRLLLDSHYLIAIPFESFILVDFAKKISGTYNQLKTIRDRQMLLEDLLSAKGINRWSPKVELKEIDVEKCGTYADTIDQIFSTYAKKCGKAVWGDKTPTYTLDIHVLSNLFPDAKFIHLIRDGRDVAPSLVRQPWGPDSFIQALNYWKEVVTWSRKMGRMLPDYRYREIHFEDLITNPKSILQQLTNFLELPFDEGMLERYQENLEAKIPLQSRAFHESLTRPIDRDLVFKWQKAIRPVNQAISYQIAGDLIEELGYPTGYMECSKLHVLIRKTYLLLSDAFRWRIKKFRQSIL